jgi:hypothetical protein
MASTKILSNFFLDAAKITFASFVVGVFLPGIDIIYPDSILIFMSGLISTGIFLWLAITLGQKMNNQTL